MHPPGDGCPRPDHFSTAPRTVVRLDRGAIIALGGDQMFDAPAVDGEGHVCVATLISRVDQDMRPDMMITNVCFDGRDRVRDAVDGRHARVQWPGPGLPLRDLNR